ncbi:unnamed protein product [Candida verbasci]|uniref:Cytochrome b5 heme-binding domain-containing protein n=1 Tax=Candida verbasci TaxID=1227364 RepID=A0A9W4TZ04_9ASCO|nr:unnamed protein product [Candida verbasci]
MSSKSNGINEKLQNMSNNNNFRRNELKPPTFPAVSSAQRVASSSSNLPIPNRQEPGRRKVILQPGHSPLDWAQLNRTTPKYKLRGVDPNTPPPQCIKINKLELQKHKSKNDCWTCINGKVFNITPYINFHPGGVDEIMKCAGKDGTSLFNKYHSWVNADRMLENCIVGVYVNS